MEIEQHLAECESCCQILTMLPDDDSLVSLLCDADVEEAANNEGQKETDAALDSRHWTLAPLSRSWISDWRVLRPKLRPNRTTKPSPNQKNVESDGSTQVQWYAYDANRKHYRQVGDTKIRYQLDGQQEPSTVAGDHVLARPKPKPAILPLKNLVGQALHAYRLDKIISSSNSGMVFRALDTERNRVAAVKVLTSDPGHSEEQKGRFVRAMKTMLPIRHPPQVLVLDPVTGREVTGITTGTDGRTMTFSGPCHYNPRTTDYSLASGRLAGSPAACGDARLVALAGRSVRGQLHGQSRHLPDTA